MPARDVHHQAFVNALIRDGWSITHDPLSLRWGTKDMFVDLGAEKLVAAERDGKRIGVEIKSFIGKSPVADLEQALGQYALYESVLRRCDPDRELFVAIPLIAYEELFEDPLGEILLEDAKIKIVVFDPFNEIIVQWNE